MEDLYYREIIWQLPTLKDFIYIIISVVPSFIVGFYSARLVYKSKPNKKKGKKS